MSTTHYTVEELESLGARGVRLPAPELVAVERSVPLAAIGDGATLHPHARLRGEATRIGARAQVGLRGAAYVEDSVVGADCVVGALGPVTLLRARLGPGTVLGCGSAEDAVFLGKETAENDATTGYGFRVRKGSIYEEDAGSAQHTDTKMTVLFPWCTLGSNVNFCDALLAGGVGPRAGEFTEVGSGAIHFNFTIRGDKATGSLFGDATHGVFLDCERLFIGGNNSLLGPLVAEYGAFTAAGARGAGRLKRGLNLGQGLPGGHTEYEPRLRAKAREVVGGQINYVGQLTALLHWYRRVRALAAAGDPDRAGLYAAGAALVALNIRERIKHLDALVASLEESARLLRGQPVPPAHLIEEQETLHRKWPEWREHLANPEAHVWDPPAALLEAVDAGLQAGRTRYTDLIRGLPQSAKGPGRDWLNAIALRCAHPFRAHFGND